MNIDWIVKSFEELSPNQLYAIMRLRIDVGLAARTMRPLAWVNAVEIRSG